MNNLAKEGAKDIKDIFSKIKKRDYRGNSGQAIKNSGYQVAITTIAKIGSLFFTILIARLMMPEIYGLYGLALSTILFLGVFSDMGISTALNTFLSKNIDNFPGKAKGYLRYLTKWRVVLSAISVLLVIGLSKWLSTTYYQKPIYYALLAGTIYLPLVISQSHLNQIFTSTNNFRPLLVSEIIFQLLRLTLIPLLIIIFLSKIVSLDIYLLWVFLAVAICYFITIVYTISRVRKNNPFNSAKTETLSNNEKKDLGKFILPLTATALSGVFFSYIDQFMLGHYVESAFLGFYQASFNLAISAASIMAFSSIAVFPILARLKGATLERGFRKIKYITFIISAAAGIFTFLLAPFIIKIVYGSMYLPSTVYLQVLSLLIISFPLIAVYTTYYTSQKKTKIISIILIASTLINITLNYFFITYGLTFGMTQAVLGACIATIISRYFYLMMLIIFKNKN